MSMVRSMMLLFFMHFITFYLFDSDRQETAGDRVAVLDGDIVSEFVQPILILYQSNKILNKFIIPR